MRSTIAKFLCPGALVALGSALAVISPAAGQESVVERNISVEVVVSAERQKVWETLTTTEGVTSFLAPAAQIELRSGGPYEVYFLTDAPEGQRGSEGCRVLSFVEGRMLSFTWNSPPKLLDSRIRRTFVVIELDDADAGKTRVRLTNGGYGAGSDWDEAFAYFSRAWPAVMSNLQKRFESGPLFSDEQKVSLKRTARGEFIYLIRPTREDFFSTGPTAEEQKLISEHFAYLKQLLAEDRLVMAGRAHGDAVYPGEGMVRLELDAPGIVVFRAADEAEARRVLEGDPAVKAGVFKGRVHRFGLALLRP